MIRSRKPTRLGFRRISTVWPNKDVAGVDEDFLLALRVTAADAPPPGSLS